MITLLLFSCSSPKKTQAEKPKIVNDFLSANGYSCTVTVTAPKLDYSFNFTRTKPSNCTVELITPESLKGLSIEINGEDTKVKYKSLYVPTEFLPLNVKSGLGFINDILSNIDTLLSTLDFKTNNGIKEFSGNYKDFDIKIMFGNGKNSPDEIVFKNKDEEYKLIIKDFILIG